MDKREQGKIYASEFDRILSDEDQEAELCDAAGISSNDLNDLKKLPLGSKVARKLFVCLAT